MADFLKDPQLQAHYDTMFEMFASKGWALLLEQVRDLHESYGDITHIATAEHLHHNRGRLDILNWITGMKAAHEAAYEALLEQEGA